ncbi:glycosyltransferase family 39 protein [Candidatus Falkowbacteria bacterium]|nr:glycosyltransferase family 39 protein [Candidatus Falkowbacteria bacterium]
MFIDFTNKYLIILFCFVVLNIIFINFFPNFATPFNSDSEQYLESAEYFRGLEATAYPQRLLKPLMPFLVAVLSPVFGFSAPFLIVNSLFYLFIGFLVFKIIKLMFGDERQTLVGSLFFVSAYPMLEYGIAFMTDMAGWFFFVWSVYLTLLFLKKPSPGLAVANGAVAAVGALAKESGAMGAVFFGLCVLFVHKDILWNKVKFIAAFAVFFLALFLPWQIFIFSKFHYDYYRWFAFNWSASSQSPYAKEFALVSVKSLVATFFFGWLFVLAGIIRWKNIAPENKKIILALIPPSFAFFAHPAISSRLFYIVGLLLSILAGVGFMYLLNNFKKIYVYSLLAMVIAGNYFWFVFDDRLRTIVNAILKITY